MGKVIILPYFILFPRPSNRSISQGAFLFSQSTLPLLLKATELQPKHPPTLIFTGATGSLRGSALMASFASGKFALRAISQALAREFGPKGVHVSHAIIDGVIDTPRTTEYLKGAGAEAKISPDSVSFKP
jgi:NAD(P)-dependent dehydrogenase (short-subunit alcohol dehydrogenase family)